MAGVAEEHHTLEQPPEPLCRSGELWELRGSSIHRQGMFARASIPAGTRIIEYIGERVTKEISNERALAWEEQARAKGEGMVYVFDLNEEYDLDGNVPNNPAKYINHSCEENCEAVNEDDRIFIYSTQDIAEGEELLFDYGYALEHFLDHPCHCGSSRCVGYIVAKADRARLKKMLRSRKGKKPTHPQAAHQPSDGQGAREQGATHHATGEAQSAASFIETAHAEELAASLHPHPKRAKN